MLESVQEQLAAKEAKAQKLTVEWNEKWREAAKILQVVLTNIKRKCL